MSKSTVLALQTGLGQAPDGQGGFLALAAPAVTFAGRLVGLLVCLVFAFFLTYLALVHVAVAAMRGEPVPAPGVAFKLALKTLPRALILPVVLVLIGMVGQILVAPAILVAVMTLNLPVILVAERLGGWRSLGTALSLRYARRPPFGGWTALFSLMSLAATAYVSIALMAFVIEGLLFADRYVGMDRGLWTLLIPGVPFGPMYLVATLFEAGALTVVLTLLPTLTTALYFSVSEKREIATA